MQVRPAWGAPIGSVVLYLLGVAANIVLLLCATVMLMYAHHELKPFLQMRLNVGAHVVSLRELGCWLGASVGCHAVLGLTSLIVFRSRYCFRFSALALSSASWCIWLLGFSIGMASLLYSMDKPFVLKHVAILAGGGLWAALNTSGATVFALARRRSIRHASAVVANNPGRYFVYLRSFATDAEKSPDRSPLFYFATLGTLWLPLLINPFYYVHFRRQTPEEIILLRGMARVCPVVAIGRPGEQVPPLGASRMYVEHGRWKELAASLADKSCAVLILPHSTEGVVWEFTELCLRAHPSKAVIILPQALASLHWARSTSTTHQADLWRTFLAALKDHPVVAKLPTALPPDALAITFEDDWSPILWIGAPTTATFGQIARYVALNAVPLDS